ncbi:MAG: UvrD-helicase domain-containing protein [Clostridia bacterium]|nr:UvrD-helicase domain-containing protein [Clostridia bacterium]
MAFTEEQLAAIGAQGKTIVSASAGSGKTTVMIEKIIRLIKSGTEVGELLALTFTKKAAAQMKEKLRKELIKSVNSPETNAAEKSMLKKQLAAVSGADISTIHSFCSKLIRSHFFAAGVSSDFFIFGDDDADGKELQRKALDSLFEEAYAAGEEDFLRLLSVYFRKKKDSTLREILTEAYSKLRVRADYREFLSGEAVRATEEKFDRLCAELLNEMHAKCEYYVRKIEGEMAYFEGCAQQRSVDNAKELIEALKTLLKEENYFSACAVSAPPFGAKQRASKSTPEGFEAHTNALAAIKDEVNKLFAENAKTRSREEELSDYLCAGEIAESLAKYLLKFDEKYSEAKRERNALDYNDLEHFALKLLSDGNILSELRKKYRHVFVDEYQDVNPVQEQILSLIGGENVFLVGDIKQSIYGFRGSKSKYFAEKQRAFEGERGANSLWLTKNFRSGDKVLEAVNSEFIYAMTKETSEVDYARDSVMNGGGMYGTNEGRVEIHFFARKPSKEEKALKKELSKGRGVYSVEANYLKEQEERSDYGKRVREIIEREHNRKWFDADKQSMRRVEYSDIAVLTRKKRGSVEKIVSALSAEGIPVTSASAVNICDFPEIKTLIDILSLIDNAQQDVPLCSALLSAMGGLNADDLTEIRLAYPSERFYRDCCSRYAKEKTDLLSHKLRAFYAYLQKLRKLSAVTEAGELLSGILADTRMEARLLALDNGARCLKRIHYFIEQTTVPEPLSVHAFLDRLRALDYEIAYSENGGENAVRVLTIHASKGLEYPVVILNDLSAPFAGREERNVLIDEQYALVPKCYRRETMTCTDTLLWRLAAKKVKAEEVKDELNLFYVALTRAKFGLHLMFSERPGVPDVRYASSYADFVDFALWEKYVAEDWSFELPVQERTALIGAADPKLTEQLFQELSREYAYPGGANLPVKTSATAQLQDVKRDAPREFNAERFSVPVLFEEEGEDKRLSGIAYHAFLEHFDFTLLEEREGHGCDEARLTKILPIVQAEKARMLSRGLLSAEEGALVAEEKAAEILCAPVFWEVSGMRLYREQKFLAGLSAKEVYFGQEEKYGACGEEELVFQGAIDLLAISETGEARIIDYKYSTHGEAELKRDYTLQLTLYKKAVAKILKLEPEKIRATIVNIRMGFAVEL